MRVVVSVVLAVLCVEGTADLLPWHRGQDPVPGYGHRGHSYSPGSRGPSWRGHRHHNYPEESGRLSHGSTSGHGYLSHAPVPGHGHLGSSPSSSPGQRVHISPPRHSGRGHDAAHELGHSPVDEIPLATPAGVTEPSPLAQGKLSSLLLLGGGGSANRVSHGPPGHSDPRVSFSSDRHGYPGSQRRGHGEPPYHYPHHDHQTHELFSHHDSPRHYRQGPLPHDSHNHFHHRFSPSSHQHEGSPPFSPYHFWRSLLNSQTDSLYPNPFHHDHHIDSPHHHHNHHRYHQHHPHDHKLHHHHDNKLSHHHTHHDHKLSHHHTHHDHKLSHHHHHHDHKLSHHNFTGSRDEDQKSSVRPPRARCPKPYKTMGNSCLHMGPVFSLRSWEDARQYCKKIDGDLLTFSSANEFAAVASFFQKLDVPRAGFWIGGRTVNNIWTWINNSTMPMGTPFWAIIPKLFAFDSRYSIAYYVQQGKLIQSNSCAAMSPEFHFYLSGEDCWRNKYPLCQHNSDGEGTQQHGHDESHPWGGQHGFQHGGYVGHHGGHDKHHDGYVRHHGGHGGHHDGYVGHHGGHGGHHGGHWGHHGGHDDYHGYFGHHGSPDRHHGGHFGHHGLYDEHHHEYFGDHGAHHLGNGEGIKENGDGDEENGEGIKENGDEEKENEDEAEAEENENEENEDEENEDDENEDEESSEESSEESLEESSGDFSGDSDPDFYLPEELGSGQEGSGTREDIYIDQEF